MRYDLVGGALLILLVGVIAGRTLVNLETSIDLGNCLERFDRLDTQFLKTVSLAEELVVIGRECVSNTGADIEQILEAEDLGALQSAAAKALEKRRRTETKLEQLGETG